MISWKMLAALLSVAAVVMMGFVLMRWRNETLREGRFSDPRHEVVGQLTVWYDERPDEVLDSLQATGPHSNLRREDYADPETCRRCHKKNYDAWFEHPHRRMNLLASSETVVGDFSEVSGPASISYLGGTATFETEADGYSMTLERDGESRVYSVEETIGSRFFQYYAGRLRSGPEPDGHGMYHTTFVLPFGYWIDQKQWVPVVHVSEEVADPDRADPFVVSSDAEDGVDYYSYKAHCSTCHSTFAFGDLMITSTSGSVWRLGRYSPHSMHFSAPGFLADAHPDLWPAGKRSFDLSKDDWESIMIAVGDSVASETGVSMGITCGACHLGVKEHAEGRMEKPPFLPSSPYLHVEAKKDISFGRTNRMLNSICARCHSGKRQEFGAGMSTWNSIEFTDAVKSPCFEEATCVDCHDPHKPIGKTWTRTAAQDDASCLKCHPRFASDELLKAHTHHQVGSQGSRCMSCHMPRINEGLQDMVRTHMIYEPTNRDMIEANEPNACNMCHTDKPIDWTLQYLGDWYGKRYNEDSIAFSYDPREQPVAVGWLKHRRSAVRLVGADCLVRSDAKWALQELVEALDDDFMVNRQFARTGLEKLTGRSLRPTGYRFFMTRAERTLPLVRIRGEWLKNGESAAAAGTDSGPGSAPSP
jgi:hypothetical protein